MVTRSILRPVLRPMPLLLMDDNPNESIFNRLSRLSLSQFTNCAFNKISSTDYRLFRPIDGDGHWQQINMSNGGVSGGPLAWNKSIIRHVLRWVTATDAALTYTGTKALLLSSDPTTYIGGAAYQYTNPNGTQYVEATFSGPCDVWVAYVGRTTGGYFKAEIDGSTTEANHLPSNGTYNYIDTYTSVDLQYKQMVKIATVGAGLHTVRLTATSDKNPAVGATRQCGFNAFGFYDADAKPGASGCDATAWAASTAYAQYSQIRTSAGRYYSCTVAGTTSASEPTHTTGTATDGSVTWAFMASSSYGNSQTIHFTGSELEYAYQIKPSGAAAYEDVGGILHGNEQMTGLSVSVDGVASADASIGANAWLYGKSISVSQAVTTTHSETGATNICTTARLLTASAAKVNVYHSHTWNVTALVGYFYSAMWPLSNWGAAEDRYSFDCLWTPGTGKALASSYYGVSNPIIGNTREYIMAASGEAMMPIGSSNAPSVLPAKYQIVASMSVTPASVNGFADETTTFAGKAMNIAGGTAPGASSVIMKMYFGRASASAPASVISGQQWVCSADYGLSMLPISADEPF